MQQVKRHVASDIEILKRPEVKQHFQDMIIESSRNGVRGPVDSIALELKDWGFSLSDISMKINIWHGELDYMEFPAGAKYVASKLPNPNLHIVPNAGHLSLVVERAEDVLRELLAGS